MDVGSTNDERTVRLPYTPPYDWQALRDFLQTRAIPGVEHFDAHSYSRAVRTASGVAIVCVSPLAAEHALELRVRGVDASTALQLSITARRVFDLDADPAQIAASFAADELLAPLVQRRPGLRIPGAWDPFECAVRAVLGQQVSVAAARTLAARVVARTAEPLARAGSDLTHLFPTPAMLASANLDGLGITGARIRALQALARALNDGSIAFSMSAAEFTSRLAALPGFGVWTAQYIALRALTAADAFPSGDLVLRRIAGGDAALSTRALQERAERWRPWRGYAVMHLWRAASDAADSAKLLKNAVRDRASRV